ncbi:MAG: CDP-6-deoxy-delta-3,4-glucoseen reductase [Burkholderiaceae bacterium]
MSFTVTVRPSNKTFTCEEGQSVLEAAQKAGIILPYGCKNGACGSCRGTVLKGNVTHGPHQAKVLLPSEAAAGEALFCCAHPHSDLEIEAEVVSVAGDILPRKMPVRIAAIERLTPDVIVLKLQLPANEKLQFFAGQYLEFLLKDGKRRSYSMASAPHVQGPVELHVRHMPGGLFTDQLFGTAQPALKERDIQRIEVPLGTFFLREDTNKPIILLASGTGFAPIKAMAEHIFFKKIHQKRKVTLYWGCRSKEDLYMHALPQQWARDYGITYVPVLSEPWPTDRWTGRTGFVHHAVMQDLPNLSGHEVYACGAPIMVDSARQDFTKKCMLPPDAFYADSFTSAADLAGAVTDE